MVRLLKQLPGFYKMDKRSEVQECLVIHCHQTDLTVAIMP